LAFMVRNPSPILPWGPDWALSDALQAPASTVEQAYSWVVAANGLLWEAMAKQNESIQDDYNYPICGCGVVPSSTTL
jgi:hypothetical protein